MNKFDVIATYLKTSLRLAVIAALCYLNTENAYSGVIDIFTARIVARNYFMTALSHSDAAHMKGSKAQMEFSLLKMVPGNMQNPLYYVFNINEDHGFIIVSATDRVRPILAYAFNEGYEESNMAPAFRSWMEAIKSQIQFAIKNEMAPSHGICQEWETYKKGTKSMDNEIYERVGPLLSTKWDQRCNYNLFCPADTSCICNRVPAGCSSVAMAQIMRYWEFPKQSNEIPGYEDRCNKNGDSEDISNSAYGWIPGVKPTVYRWSGMPNSLSSSSNQMDIEEIARLIYHCGMSMKTNYGPKYSTACFRDYTHAFTTCFNYDSSIQIVYRVTYFEDTWEEMLKGELDAGRPVLYAASGPNGGHGFICDGYDNSGYFHFNWGWSGANDGYYYVGNLSPGSNKFNEFQRAVIGISPDSSLTHTSVNAHENIHVYPNPARDLLIIEAETNEEYSIEIISVKGQLIYGSEGLRFPQQIDLSPIPNGTYFLRIRSKDFVMTRKIIKL